MKKSLKPMIGKLLVLLAIIALGEIFKESLSPLLTTQMSIKAQLADSNVTYAGLELWRKLHTFTPILYILVAYFLFRKEINSLLKKNKEEMKDENKN